MDDGGEFSFLFNNKRQRSTPLQVPPLTERSSSSSEPPAPRQQAPAGQDAVDDPIGAAIAAAVTARDNDVQQQTTTSRGPESKNNLNYGLVNELISERFASIHEEIDRALDEKERIEERKRQEHKEAQARIAETLERNPNVSRAPKRISFLRIVERVKIKAEQIKKDYQESLYLPHITEAYVDPFFNDRPSDGEQVFQRLLECFAVFPKPPTHFQHKLFTAAMSACAPMIFGDAFFSDVVRYMALIKGRFTDGLVGVLTGRKTGKSTGLAYIAICLMFCIKRFRCIVTSKTQEQAQIILDTVKGLIQTHPMWKAWGFTIEETRATALVIRGQDGTLRWIEARCGSGEVRVSLVLFSSIVCVSGRWSIRKSVWCDGTTIKKKNFPRCVSLALPYLSVCCVSRR